MNALEENTTVLARKLVREAVVSASSGLDADGSLARSRGEASTHAGGMPADADRQAVGAEKAFLVFLGGDLHGTRLPLKVGKNILGRDADADLRLDFEGVSRQHAIVWWQESPAGFGFAVEDLGSKNGVAHNGRRVTGVQAMSHGDEIGVGPMRLVLDLGQSRDPAAGDELGSQNSQGKATRPTRAASHTRSSLADAVIVVTSLVALTALAAAWYWVKS